MTVYILGGGPSGLAVVDSLKDKGIDDFILIENSDNLGGLAKTITWENVGSHDLGPHKIFSLDRKLVKRVENLLPKNQWLIRDKKSTIYINKNFLPYPPSPFSLLKVFGLSLFIKMNIGYLLALIKRIFIKKENYTFKSDLINRLGSTLYELLFEPLAFKLWGDPEFLDSKLSKGRIQTPSVKEILLNLFFKQKKSDFEAKNFKYPVGGLNKIWDAIINKSSNLGKIYLNTKIIDLKMEDDKIKEIHTTKQTFALQEKDFVISTIPLGLTVSFLSKYLDDIQSKYNDSVFLNDLFLVFLNLKQKKLLKDSWVFVPDPKICFHRISEQNSFDPNMTNNGSILCCEIMNTKLKNLEKYNDDEMINMVTEDLKKMGYNFDVKCSKIIKLKKTYPVYIKGYKNKLDYLLDKLDTISNFKTIGRQGSFNYIGTLDAMDIGYGIAEWYFNKFDWKDERRRTNHYPVLD